MKKFYEKRMFWSGLGFAIWLILNLLNARMFLQGQSEGRFPPGAEPVLIPVAGVAILTAIVFIGLPFFVFFLLWVTKKISVRYSRWITVGILLMIIVPTWMSYSQSNRMRNLGFISRDIGYELAFDTPVVLSHSPLGFDLDSFTCTKIKLAPDAMAKVKKRLSENPAYKREVFQPDANWKPCFETQDQFQYFVQNRSENGHEIKVVVGFDEKAEIMVHAFADRFVAKQ